MERHKCKLCARTFANGRALGGHMKAHLATLPLPPKTQQLTESASSSSSSSVDAGSVIQDRESETESKNPTRRRSKRNRRSFKKPMLTNSTQPSLAESMAEPEPVSSVSDTSPEEDVAMCLMMLSRDRVRGKNRCEKCSKLFRSYQAMCGHKKICFRNEDEAINNAGGEKLFECPFCCKIFGSGQALGGHKRSHLSGSSRSMAAGKTEVRESFIDLNLPAPQEEDDFSVLSDA
ncbi:zinc finger protein ZAT1 [Prunus yedoensis var. nudiflora]|uniref:Zinc finger protein ZAT1 n=1 Tax=Prunus yedoensis var. nudiflora TaxID=2094558 RepID=A0A314U716_PRUYE|nr:zinc finger protein ZAT1 [Prunus yedoensis var. nudiflora]